MDIKFNQNIFTPNYQTKQKQHAQPIKKPIAKNLAPLGQDTVSFSKKKSVGFGNKSAGKKVVDEFLDKLAKNKVFDIDGEFRRINAKKVTQFDKKQAKKFKEIIKKNPEDDIIEDAKFVFKDFLPKSSK